MKKLKALGMSVLMTAACFQQHVGAVPIIRPVDKKVLLSGTQCSAYFAGRFKSCLFVDVTQSVGTEHDTLAFNFVYKNCTTPQTECIYTAITSVDPTKNLSRYRKTYQILAHGLRSQDVSLFDMGAGEPGQYCHIDVLINRVSCELSPSLSLQGHSLRK